MYEVTWGESTMERLGGKFVVGAYTFVTALRVLQSSLTEHRSLISTSIQTIYTL